jgi:hypothetical protein
MAKKSESPRAPVPSALALVEQLREKIVAFKDGTQVRSRPRGNGPGKHRYAAEVREVETIQKTLNVVLAELDQLAASLAVVPSPPQTVENAAMKVAEAVRASADHTTWFPALAKLLVALEVVPSQETTKDDLHQQIMNLPTQIQKYTKDIDNSGTWIDGYLIGHRDARHAAAELASAALAVVGEATPQPEPTQIDQFNSQDADLPRS